MSRRELLNSNSSGKAGKNDKMFLECFCFFKKKSHDMPQECLGYIPRAMVLMTSVC